MRSGALDPAQVGARHAGFLDAAFLSNDVLSDFDGFLGDVGGAGSRAVGAFDGRAVESRFQVNIG